MREREREEEGKEEEEERDHTLTYSRTDVWMMLIDVHQYHSEDKQLRNKYTHNITGTCTCSMLNQTFNFTYTYAMTIQPNKALKGKKINKRTHKQLLQCRHAHTTKLFPQVYMYTYRLMYMYMYRLMYMYMYVLIHCIRTCGGHFDVLY